MGVRTTALLVAAALAAGSAAAGGVSGSALARATVTVGSGCTGVLVERSQLVATALHCVRDAASLPVVLSDGSRHTAWVVGTDADADQAVLFVPDPIDLAPLDVAAGRPIAGSIVFFGGRPDRFRVREARIDRIGACPSLPALPDALFTTIDGVPGDSGAPLVDVAGRVVGLVHGGQSCEIATPGSTLDALVRDVLDRVIPTRVRNRGTRRRPSWRRTRPAPGRRALSTAVPACARSCRRRPSSSGARRS